MKGSLRKLGVTSGQGSLLTGFGDKGWAGPALEPKRTDKEDDQENLGPSELSGQEYPHHSCIPPAHVMKKCGPWSQVVVG